MNNCSVWTTALALEAIGYARNARVDKGDCLSAEGRGGGLFSVADERIDADRAKAWQGSSAGFEIAPLLAQMTIYINEKVQLWPRKHW